MLAAYFSPLAPAAILLLGAFILFVLIPRLPDEWQEHWGLRFFGAPALVGLALIVLLATRLSFGQTGVIEEIELLSGWNFSTPDSVATLVVGIDRFSLPFLLLTLLVLLTVALVISPLSLPGERGITQSKRLALWLLLGAGAYLLFVSSNRLTLAYTVVLFDLLTGLYWFGQSRPQLSVARLLLGLVTAGAIVSVSLSPSAGLWGLLLLAFALWLRLGLYSYFELAICEQADGQKSEPGQDHRLDTLVYLVLSLTVGMYLAIRVITEPLPDLVSLPIVFIMALGGLMIWLANQRYALLGRFFITEALLVFLIGPSSDLGTTAFAIGLVSGITALWIIPPLGKLKLSDLIFAWPYLPIVVATLTLVGIPFSLGWPVRILTYGPLFSAANLILFLVVLGAEMLAFTALIRYWILVWQGEPPGRQGWWSALKTVLLWPWLIPGLAPVVLAAVMQVELLSLNYRQPLVILASLGLIILGATGLTYFRTRILDRLKLTPAYLTELPSLQWLPYWSDKLFNQLGKVMLRVNAVLEGQHYLGWAIFVALVGALVILLRL